MKRSYLTFSFRGKKIAVKCNGDDELMKALVLVCTLRDATEIKVLDVVYNSFVIMISSDDFNIDGLA